MLVLALVEGTHDELLPVQLDLLVEPVLPVLAVDAGGVDGGDLGVLLEERGLARISGAGELVGEQRVARHVVEDVVHALNVAG